MPHEEPSRADEPLIPRTSDGLSEDRDNDVDALKATGEDGSDSITVFVWMLTVAAGVSGLLFGYDTGVISSTLVSIGSDLSSRPLGTVDKSLVTSCTSLFALIASPATGALADALGRKRVILIADILFIVGALWQAWTTTVWGMIGGRSVVGLAVGSASFVVPLYISELAPSRFRGRLVTISVLFITVGQMVAYIIGWVFSTKEHGWRYMVGLGALPAIVQFVILGFMPETPRWLAGAGRTDHAKQVLRKVYGAGQDASVDAVLKRIERSIAEEAEITGPKSPEGWFLDVKNTASELLSIPANRRALTIACLLQGFQQLCGFNSLMYFSATIFALVGFRSPTLTSLSIATTNFVFTVVAFYAIDRIGRRRILVYSVPIMTIGQVLCSVAFNFVKIPDGDAASHGVTPQQGSTQLWPSIILIAMVVYVAGYAIGLGNVPWQQSELFSLSVRSLGSAFATATNWSANFVIGLTFLPLMEFLSPVWTFALYACICVVGWFLVWKIYPETCGLSLEEVGALLQNEWGVEESVRRMRDRRRHIQE